MASFFFRARATAVTALIGALAAQTAIAADMPSFVSGDAPIFDHPVEFGTGWYLRGDIGYSNMQIPVIVADFANSLGRTGSVSGGLGFGYQYNPWLRTDFTIDRSVFRLSNGQPPVWCPSGAVATFDASAQGGVAGQPMGYLYNPAETCTTEITASFDRTSPMFNVYFDLGHWSGFTPYVGAGLGLSYLQSTASVSWIQNWNGQPWAPNLLQSGVPLVWTDGTYTNVTTTTVTPTVEYITQTVNGVTTTTPTIVNVPTTTTTSKANTVTPPRALVFQQLNPNTSMQKKSWKFSWNVMAGVSYDVTQNVKIDLHYRYLDIGSYTGLPSQLTGAPGVTKELTSQEVRLGVRLTAD